MKKIITPLILSVFIVIFSFPNIVYSQGFEVNVQTNSVPGPKIEEVKGKQQLFSIYSKIKNVRENLSVVNIQSNTSKEELNKIYKNLDYYLLQINTIKKEIDLFNNDYKDSFNDLYLAEIFNFIGDSFALSIRQQQLLITQLKNDNQQVKKLFYSEYLIPAYYYLTLGDQMVSYIDTYFQIT